MEHQEREILVHRINVCGRTVRFPGIGELHVDICKESLPCSIVGRSRTLYSFSSLDECEEWCDAQLEAEWIHRVKDPLVRMRCEAAKARAIAREMNYPFYDLPSKMNRCTI